jgi:hypothetical protein
MGDEERGMTMGSDDDERWRWRAVLRAMRGDCGDEMIGFEDRHGETGAS